MSILPKLIYKLNATLIKNLSYFIELDRLILKFIRKNKHAKNNQENCQLTFSKGPKEIKWERKSFQQIVLVHPAGYLHVKE